MYTFNVDEDTSRAAISLFPLSDSEHEVVPTNGSSVEIVVIRRSDGKMRVLVDDAVVIILDDSNSGVFEFGDSRVENPGPLTAHFMMDEHGEASIQLYLLMI